MRPISIRSPHALGLLAVLAVGCDPYGHWPDRNPGSLDSATWDPDVVATNSGLYVRLPQSGKLVQVKEDGTYSEVDLDGASPDALVAAPDGDRVLVFASWFGCTDTDPTIVNVSDCPPEKLTTGHELDIVKEGKRVGRATVPGQLNQVAFSPDGQTAALWYDYDASGSFEVEGLADLTEVQFLPLGEGELTPTGISLGTPSGGVLFTPDGAEALLLSRDQVTVYDVVNDSVLAEFPLTLDAASKVDPSDVALTPDGRYALVRIQGSADLYKLDLENPSIDIISLDAVPSDLVVDATSDQTIIVYGSEPKVDLMNHEYFTSESIDLDSPQTDILEGEGYSLLYNTEDSRVHDIYRMDNETGDLTRYVADNPVSTLELSPSGDYAVAILHPESSTNNQGLDAELDQYWLFGIIDLVNERMTAPPLQDEPVGTALVENDTSTYALLLLQNDENLLYVDLAQPSAAQELPLPAPPVGIGAMPDGRFYIVHDAALGLVSFLDPSTLEITSTGGFGTVGLMGDDTLPRQKEN